MPVRKTPLVSGYLYHIFNRGINKIPIFSYTRDYQRFLQLMTYCCYADYPIKFSHFNTLPLIEKEKIRKNLKQKFIDFVCYCLMPNHFHFLLLQVKDNGISQFINRLLDSYTKYFNIKSQRSGPLFEQRFKAVLVDKDEQLLHLTRYIHLNPYSSFIIKKTDDLIKYPWSSLTEYLNPQKEEVCQKKKLVLDFFDKPKELKKFTLDQADYQRNLEIIKHLSFE